LIQIGTFEVTSQYFAFFILISSLIFENDKWTFWGCFGHFNICITTLTAYFSLLHASSKKTKSVNVDLLVFESQGFLWVGQRLPHAQLFIDAQCLLAVTGT